MKKAFLLLAANVSFLCAYAQSAAATDLVKAAASLAWPILALIIFCLLYPQIKAVIRSKDFSLKVAGMEVTVQSAANQLSEQIHELQKKTIELACAVENNQNGERTISVPKGLNKKHWRVLWITQNHQNHAFEIDYLQKDGVEVVRANSTKEAMEILENQADTLDAIITGVKRKENNVVNPQAGIDLIKKVKKAGLKTPVFVMCSEESIRQYYTKLKAEGATEATSSSLDLLSFLQNAGINCSLQQKAASNAVKAESVV